MRLAWTLSLNLLTETDPTYMVLKKYKGRNSLMIFSFSKNFYFSTRFYRKDSLPVDN